MSSWTDQILFVATGSCARDFWMNFVLWYVSVWEGVNVDNVCCWSFNEIIFNSSRYELFHGNVWKQNLS